MPKRFYGRARFFLNFNDAKDGSASRLRASAGVCGRLRAFPRVCGRLRASAGVDYLVYDTEQPYGGELNRTSRERWGWRLVSSTPAPLLGQDVHG